AGRARIPFGRVHGALLVPHQDVLDLLLLEQGVVDRQHGSAGIAEDVLDPLIAQRLDHHFRPGHFFAHRQLHRSMPQKIKKGREGPLRTATFADGLAIPGGAASHDYEHLSNKVAHSSALWSLRYPHLYGVQQGQSSKPDPLATGLESKVNKALSQPSPGDHD